METGAKTAPEANLMVDVRIACPTCHKVRETSSTGTELVRGSTAMCATCHDAATVKQFEAYHVSLRGALPVLQATLAKVETAVKQPGDHPAALVTEIGDLRHDLDLLRGQRHPQHALRHEGRAGGHPAAGRRLPPVEGRGTQGLAPAPVQEKPTSTHVDANKATPAKPKAK